METETKLDVKHCTGCENDFYNDRNPYGVKECWSRNGAKLEQRLLIHVDQPPPYLHLKPQLIPDCYKLKRHVSVRVERINGTTGYWAS